VPYRSNKDKAVVFTPYSLQRKVIENAHGKPLTSHWAVERTVQRIEQNYFWPTLTRDVTEFIRRCKECQLAARPPPPAALTPWEQTSQPNERVHIDLYSALQGDPHFKYVAPSQSGWRLFPYQKKKLKQWQKQFWKNGFADEE
jgi:hypothetical protein